MAALFSIAIIGFAVNFASDNSAEIDISDDPEIATFNSNLEADLGTLTEESNSTYQSIVESSLDEGETTPSGGQFAITPLTYLSIVKNTLAVGYLEIFGSGDGFGIFITALLSFIGFVFGLYIWKTWIGRNPD